MGEQTLYVEDVGDPPLEGGGLMDPRAGAVKGLPWCIHHVQDPGNDQSDVTAAGVTNHDHIHGGSRRGRVRDVQHGRQADERQDVAAILDDFPAAGTLDGSDRDFLEALDGREAQGRVVSVRHVSHPDEVRGAHVLFVSQSHPDIPAAVKWAERMPILTVTESDAVRPGSIINLVRVGSRIGFDVDLDAAGVARLRVSSRLLSVARAIQKRTAHGSH